MSEPIDLINPEADPHTPPKIHAHNSQLTSRAQQREQEYYMKYEKWQQLRLRMKSMQLNKVEVTTYLNSKPTFQKKQDSQRSPSKADCKGRFSKVPTCTNKDRKELKAISVTEHRRFYTSKNKFKPGSQLYAGIQLTHFPAQDQQQVNLKQGPSPEHMSLEHKIKRRTARQQNKRNKLNTSVYLYNKDSSKDILNLKPKTRSKKVNKDLELLAKITTQDCLQRLIVRKKSNISHGRMEAIEASIIRGRIIMFTIEITEGEDELNMNKRARSSNNSKRQIQTENRSKKVNTYAGTKQLKLMLGPTEIREYIELFGLSCHPLELESSTSKIAVILVDYLEVSEAGLKIDKTQIIANVKNASPEIKKINLNEAYKKLQSSELVRWKTNHHSHNNHYHGGHRSQQQSRRTHHQIQQFRTDRSNHNTSHELYGQAGRFQVYGHPHPKINGKECSMLAAVNVPTEQINAKEQTSNRNKDTISIGEEIVASHQNSSRAKSRN